MSDVQTQEAKDTLDAIKGVVLTQARYAMGDVRISISDSGRGYELKTLSYLDVLLENEIITESHYDVGTRYWNLREKAFYELSAKIGKYGDPLPPDPDEEIPETDEAELADSGVGPEIYQALMRVFKDDPKAIGIFNACCSIIPCNSLANRLIVIQVIGEGEIKRAFAKLEDKYLVAREDALRRIENEDKKSSCNDR